MKTYFNMTKTYTKIWITSEASQYNGLSAGYRVASCRGRAIMIAKTHGV
jgi:hypothetical protein